VIRVAVLASVDRPCGVGDVAIRLAQALPEGFQPTLIPLPVRARRSDWRRVRRLAGDHDLVHVHYEYSLFHVVKPLRNRLASLLGGIGYRTVVSLHGALPRLDPRWPGRRAARDAMRDLAYLPFFAGWEAVQYRRARHWIAYARPVHDRAERFLPARRLSLLPLPVPHASSRWQPSPSDGPLIVTPGFIKRDKGYELLIEVLGRLPEWRWVMAGGAQGENDRRYLEELRRTIHDAGLAGRVHISGYRPQAEVESQLARATIAVLPYHFAAASASLAWAIACGTPVLAADLPSFAEVAGDGAGVELVDGRDPDRWARALAALAADEARLRRLSAASHEYAARHDDAAVAAQHASLYAGLIGSAPR
jgi:glycosyltransferase involved in cell wall biosynthesis